MPFEKRFNEIVSKINIPSEWTLRKHSFFFSIGVFLIVLLYKFVERGKIDLRLINQTTAWVSVILIGLSFILSGVCYFWNFADKYIIYRKYIGLLGFWYAVVHVALTIYSLSKRFNVFSFLLSEERILYFMFGLLALIVFMIMTAISNKYAAHELGGKLWRKMLRFGYVGFAFAVFHFVLVGINQWTKWIHTLKGIPPIGIIVLEFSLFVIILRVLLEIDIRLKRPLPPA